MRKFFAVVVASMLVVGVVAVAAFAGSKLTASYFGTFHKKADKGAAMGFGAKLKNGKPKLVTRFQWDNFTCVKGGEGFTGGASGKSFHIRHGQFHGSRPVADKAPTNITAKVTGEFVSKVKAKGTLKLSGGGCDWKDSWTASAGG